MARVEELNKILRSLRTSSPEIEACALISEDSLMIASALPQNMEERCVSGVSATLLSLGGRATGELGRGKLDQVLVHGDDGYAVMSRASDETLLLVVAKEGARLGLLFLDMNRAAEHIRRVL